MYTAVWSQKAVLRKQLLPFDFAKEYIIRLLRYERMYLPVFQVANTHFHIQGDDM